MIPHLKGKHYCYQLKVMCQEVFLMALMLLVGIIYNIGDYIHLHSMVEDIHAIVLKLLKSFSLSKTHLFFLEDILLALVTSENIKINTIELMMP